MGSKKRPFFRIVATDSRSPRDGRFIEILGYYNPMVDPPDIKFDDDKVYKWLDVGAEPSSNVAQLLKRAGLLERWRLLKQGVKISELDAKIAERREKQPKPKPKEEREADWEGRRPRIPPGPFRPRQRDPYGYRGLRRQGDDQEARATLPPLGRGHSSRSQAGCANQSRGHSMQTRPQAGFDPGHYRDLPTGRAV